MLDVLFRTDVGIISLIAFLGVVGSGLAALALAWRMMKAPSDETQ